VWVTAISVSAVSGAASYACSPNDSWIFNGKPTGYYIVPSFCYGS